MAVCLLTLVAGCDKDNDTKSAESVFFGMWVKGSNTGDTLYFVRKNGQNIMRMNMSFNPGMFAPSDREFKFEDGILQYKLGFGSPWFPIESFTWIIPGREFEIKGHQLFMFMSSTLATFNFKKVTL